MHEYDANFYLYNATFAISSARRVSGVLLAALPITSVVDFGCGQGAWLSVWKQAGAEVTGLDGPYIDRHRLMIAADEFVPADLSKPIALNREFDLVQSLEVAEHIPAMHAEQFVRTLTSHGKLVLFSAARPDRAGNSMSTSNRWNTGGRFSAVRTMSPSTMSAP